MGKSTNNKSTERITGAEAVVRALLEEGADLAYGYPGVEPLCQSMMNYISTKINYSMY